MDVGDFEQIKQFLQESLTINAAKEGGEYGSRKYIEITLELDGKVISQCWIDE